MPRINLVSSIGTIKAPSSETNPDDYAAWSRCNDMVHSWIVNSITPDIFDSVIYYTTAREVWEDLREHFSQSNAPRIFQIQREIAYLKQEQLSVAAYYTKLKDLWDELASYTDSICTCGVQQDRQKLMQFLMGLNESYSADRGQILMMNPLPLQKSKNMGNRGSVTSVNNVSESTSKDDLKPIVSGLSDTQIQHQSAYKGIELFSDIFPLLVYFAGSGFEEDDWFG
ncbi:uncharacterized protein LOC133744425 [Rosa rugosa]|uniref:uncharacterized protein LOC133744425 n=1 Tax=Rosa rugosa TaxID=74645 RepID=UPI002B403ABF|nr:uncharacterized protein LOC133744425 [Rosa rugosa]